MIASDVVKKIKEIQIHTRRALQGTQVGGHVTTKKGFGYEFDQIRSYQFGDDIRFVDWKSSARAGKLLVKQYLDERNRTILLFVDVSASTFFSSQDKLKSDAMQQVAAVLTLLAEYEQDNVGLVLFSDHIEKVIPPKSGHNHAMRIMEALFSHKPQGKKTNLDVAFTYLLDKFKREAIVFMISDFIDSGFENSLRKAVCKCEIIAIRCLDAYEKQAPKAGYVWSCDPETNQTVLLNFSGYANREMQKRFRNRIEEQSNLLKKYHVDILELVPGREIVQDIILFFRKRMMCR